MLYYVIRGAFLLLCRKKNAEPLVDEADIISMLDRDFEILYKQYSIRSTEKFEDE